MQEGAFHFHARTNVRVGKALTLTLCEGDAQVSTDHLQILLYDGASSRMCCPWSSCGRTCRQIWPWTELYHGLRSETEDTQSRVNLQVPRTRRLSSYNMTIWHHRQLHNSNSKYCKCSTILECILHSFLGRTRALSCKTTLSTIWQKEGWNGPEYRKSRGNQTIH